MAKRKEAKDKPKETPEKDPETEKPSEETVEEVTEEKEEEKESPEEKYRRAGKIASQVREEILPQVKVGALALDICETAEARIIELGGGIGFPTNVSLNEIAAHYSSPAEDTTAIQDGDIVKVDIGVHVDGYIADTAFTVGFNPELDTLVEASREALNKALLLIRPKTNSKDLGKIIEDTIKGYGYRPIRDLSGHQLDEYILHGAKNLPNIAVPHGSILEEGEAYALETFATTGTGSVHETGQHYIFSLNPTRTPVRSQGARDIIRLVAREFKSLPFSRRYLAKHIPKLSLALGLRELTTKKVLRQYSVLADTKGSRVAQTEHTFLVTKDGIEITTK
ncbi:MAG: type II methionyl aminopeptidase [Candidatus Hermodarchaeia archaeon]|jgi:methionyl aminopeptidase